MPWVKLQPGGCYGSDVKSIRGWDNLMSVGEASGQLLPGAFAQHANRSEVLRFWTVLRQEIDSRQGLPIASES